MQRGPASLRPLPTWWDQGQTFPLGVQIGPGCYPSTCMSESGLKNPDSQGLYPGLKNPTPQALCMLELGPGCFPPSSHAHLVWGCSTPPSRHAWIRANPSLTLCVSGLGLLCSLSHFIPPIAARLGPPAGYSLQRDLALPIQPTGHKGWELLLYNMESNLRFLF